MGAKHTVEQGSARYHFGAAHWFGQRVLRAG